MSKRTPGKKRPADVVSNAVHVMRVLTGQAEDTPPVPIKEKDAAAVALGRKGGAARANKLTDEQKSEIARNAARARWPQKGKK